MSNLVDFSGSLDELKAAIAAHPGLVVVKFGSTTCMPCKRVRMLMPGFAKENPSVLFMNVEVDQDPERVFASAYNITSVPNTKFFKAGEEVDYVIGAAVPQIKAKIAQYSQ